ncbi:hypothetical protein DFH09DRAFT_1482340 [Mycena vulgaris]|nr:hypothetical protein DFH09DRAFT_1482340 [Mycena vulgaris]
MLAVFAALHPAAAFVSTTSPATFKHTIFPLPLLLPDSSAAPIDLRACSTAFPGSPAHWGVHSVRPGFATPPGLPRGVLYVEVDTMLRERVQWTLEHQGMTDGSPALSDALATRPAACMLIAVALTGTNHIEDRAVHLRVVRSVDGPALGGGSAKENENGREEGEKRGADAQETAAQRRARRGECRDVCGATAARASGAGV